MVCPITDKLLHGGWHFSVTRFFTCAYGENTYNTAMSVRMRHTRGHTNNRRSHHALKAPRFSKDSETGDLHIRHRVNMKTGRYRGRVVIDVAKIEEKKADKARKKELEVRERGGEQKDSRKPVEPEALSKH